MSAVRSFTHCQRRAKTLVLLGHFLTKAMPPNNYIDGRSTVTPSIPTFCGKTHDEMLQINIYQS